MGATNIGVLNTSVMSSMKVTRTYSRNTHVLPKKPKYQEGNDQQPFLAKTVWFRFQAGVLGQGFGFRVQC